MTLEIGVTPENLQLFLREVAAVRRDVEIANRIGVAVTYFQAKEFGMTMTFCQLLGYEYSAGHSKLSQLVAPLQHSEALDARG